jgi:micrococcal nuclease
MVIIAGAVLLGACAPASSAPPATGSGPPGTYLVVDRVVDGDTIVVRDGQGGDVHVRLIGVDTPESVKPDTPVQCFALAASNFTKHALTGKVVRLEFDVERFDRFGRTLAYVWVGDTMFNEELVAQGYAVVATFPPDVRYVERFLAAERRARAHDRGLWSHCATP